MPGAAADPQEVQTLDDRSRAYAHPDWLRYANFLWASSHRASWPRPGEYGISTIEPASVFGQLEEHGHRVIGVDITAPDVAGHGLFVVRAVVPDLQPLALGGGARLGGRRLYEAPVGMGYRGVSPHEEELYTFPHCFP
jgi:ribosomal protein S12 methylthiotransferase accessory factor